MAGNPRAQSGRLRAALKLARGRGRLRRRRRTRARADDSSHEGTPAPADERGPERGGNTFRGAAHHGSPGGPAPSPGVRAGASRPAPRAQAATARAVATPLPVPPLGAISLRVLRAGRSLQDSTLLERLVRGRGWILLLGTLLFGLVALNVSLLKLNAAAGHNAERAKVLRIQNAKLRGKVSRLASGDRLRAAAADMGLVMPEPKKIHYLSARPDRDPGRAVRNIRDGTALRPDRRPRLGDAADRQRGAGPDAAGADRGNARARSGGTDSDPRSAGAGATANGDGRHDRRRRRPDRSRRRLGAAAASPATLGDSRQASRAAWPTQSSRAGRSRQADRAPCRPAVRGVPRPARLRQPAGRLPARLQGRRPQAARRHAAGRERHRDRPARHDHRPQRRRAGRVGGCLDRFRDAVSDQGPGRHGASRRAPDRPAGDPR